MRLLVIEDERQAGKYVQRSLTESGFVVDLMRTGSDGMLHNDDWLIKISSSAVNY
jgi:DNA-binding response OmpR family regulator